MGESSWREQEGLDRRVAALEAEKAALASALEAARADAEAAQHEAAVQRRLARRMQSRPAAPAEARPAEAQVAALLQKRVKVLEAQVIRLRLAASSAAEEAALAAAAPVPAAEAGPSAAENVPPNSGQEEAEANPVVLKWEADKRLQKKAEGLAAKLKVRPGICGWRYFQHCTSFWEKCTLVSLRRGRKPLLPRPQPKLQEKSASLQAALAAKARLEEQAQGLRGESERHQAAARELRRQLQDSEQRAAPGATVPAARVQALLRELDDLQARHDASERALALLRRGASGGSGGGGGATPLASPGGAGCVVHSGRGSPGRAEAGGAERRYNPADYGGTAAEDVAAAAAQRGTDALLQKVRAVRNATGGISPS